MKKPGDSTDKDVPADNPGTIRKNEKAGPADKKNPEKEKAAKTVKKEKTFENPDHKDNEKKDINKKTGPVTDGGLLAINEGNFKYERIPGIKLKDENIGGLDKPVSEETIEQTNEKMESTDTRDGLFGFTQETTDLMAKIVLVGVIVIILIIYRFRSRSNRSRVLNRFPKS